MRVSFLIPRPRGPNPSQLPSRVELIRVDYPPDSHPSPDPDTFRRRGRVVAESEGTSFVPGSRVTLEDPTMGRLPGDGVGWILRYGIRVRDHRGRLSPLVVSKDLIPVEPPPPPSGLQAEATADGIRLKWLPPEGHGDLPYNVYRTVTGQPFGETPINRDPLTATEFLDSDVTSGTSYTYAVRTSASEGRPFRESVSSPAVTVLAEDRFAPVAPERIVAVQEGMAVRLLWNPNQEMDLAGYRVYRKVGDAGWSRIGPDLVDRPAYLDEDVRVGQHLAYRVTAVDRANPPNEGPPSESVETDVGQEPASPEGNPP